VKPSIHLNYPPFNPDVLRVMNFRSGSLEHDAA
jgi:hypothetical protein